jgi:hypothetical protein
MVVIQFRWLNRVPETIKPYDKMNLDGQENDFTAIVEELRRFETAGCPAVSVLAAGEICSVRIGTHTHCLPNYVSRSSFVNPCRRVIQALLQRLTCVISSLKSSRTSRISN